MFPRQTNKTLLRQAPKTRRYRGCAAADFAANRARTRSRSRGVSTPAGGGSDKATR